MEGSNAHTICTRTKHGLAWSPQGLDSISRCRAHLAGTGHDRLKLAPVRPEPDQPTGHTRLQDIHSYQT